MYDVMWAFLVKLDSVDTPVAVRKSAGAWAMLFAGRGYSSSSKHSTHHSMAWHWANANLELCHRAVSLQVTLDSGGTRHVWDGDAQ